MVLGGRRWGEQFVEEYNNPFYVLLGSNISLWNTCLNYRNQRKKLIVVIYKIIWYYIGIKADFKAP